MNKASSLLFLVLLGSLVADAVAQINPRPSPSVPRPHQPGQQTPYLPQELPSMQLPSQQGRVISQRVLQSVRGFERVRISELLRLSMSESRDLEVSSLIIVSQSSRTQASLEVLSLGRSVQAPQIIRRQLSEMRLQLPARTLLDDLEISVSDDAIIESISVEVKSSYNPLPQQPREMQPMSGQMLELSVRQDIRGAGEIGLKQLVKQQLGLSLEGSQIERIVLQGQVLRGVSASVQVELNNRPVGPVKMISQATRQTPIPLNSIEEVRGALRLIVRGDVIITSIMIRVGLVRPIIQQAELPLRIQVSQEISAGRSLELSRLMPYENRLIKSISIEARSSRLSQAEVALLALGQISSSVIVSQVPMRPVLKLMRPMLARELSLQSLSPVIIDSLEVSFESQQMW